MIEAVTLATGRNRAHPIATVQVPFADVSRPVPRVAQDFAEIIAIAGHHLDVVLHGSVPKRVHAGKKNAPIWRAQRRVTNTVRETHTFLSEAIELRRYYLPVAVTAKHVRGLL